ncbi:MAG: ATP-dependent DNA helicase [Pseudomonadales bacterium]|nr:ATP-dependent DNA helicase [Pseudomonadales bacterium]
MSARIPVTWLAAFVHRRGDLHGTAAGITRPEEGVRAQRALQAALTEGQGSYQCERPVALSVTLATHTFVLGGRIDGCDTTARPVLIEEFKATRADPANAHAANGAEHWAQARLYAGMLGREGIGNDGFLLRLRYCHPETLAERRFEATFSRADAEAFLVATLDELETWIAAQAAHERARDSRIAGLAFPYGTFRPHQHPMARRAYRALRDREGLLLEAPTGSGKSAAMLYPAVRALEAAACSRVFFLTSRGTGAHAARDALARMDPAGEWLRQIRIVAREQACRIDGAACDPASCPRAIGYYDRSRAAVRALLDRYAMTEDTVVAVAAAHCVCPHELALDAALWSDVVIGDYNYVFDPVVRLQRFAGEPTAALLIDEAHQLAPRVREMLSLTLGFEALTAALDEAPPAALVRRIEGVARQFRKLARAMTGTAGRSDDGWQESAIEAPAALLRALARFCDTVVSEGIQLDAWPATRALYFDAVRWVRDGAPDDAPRWLHTIRIGPHATRDIAVALECLDPGPWIAERLGEYGGHVRFSGTVSPLPLYQALHGLPDAVAERAGNPFDPTQLAVLIVDDLPTYLRTRSQSLDRLVALVGTVVGVQSGNYLVAFPSFDYLRQFENAWRAAHPGHPLVVQAPGMDQPSQSAFLAAFRDAAQPRTGLVVLGGVFGESVDFSGARLAGVICVGLGLPPPSTLRDAQASYFAAQGLDGQTVAYRQPAMVKVVQMAGRLLRGPEDRGVICLVDPRFTEPACRAFYPAHWRPVRVRAGDLGARLANFWRDAAALPRLRATEQETTE